jgi:hypothetical protein
MMEQGILALLHSFFSIPVFPYAGFPLKSNGTLAPLKKTSSQGP